MKTDKSPTVYEYWKIKAIEDLGFFILVAGFLIVIALAVLHVVGCPTWPPCEECDLCSGLPPGVDKENIMIVFDEPAYLKYNCPTNKECPTSEFWEEYKWECSKFGYDNSYMVGWKDGYDHNWTYFLEIEEY